MDKKNKKKGKGKKKGAGIAPHASVYQVELKNLEGLSCDPSLLTDIDSLNTLVEKTINLNISMKTGVKLDDAVSSIIHEAVCFSTPGEGAIPKQQIPLDLPFDMEQLILTKKKFKRKGLKTGYPAEKIVQNKFV